MRFVYRHFPLTSIHPHALAAAAAAEAGAPQDRFWDMHELLFHRQQALENSDLLGYAAQLGLDVTAFDRDRASTAVAERIRRDVNSGLASRQVLGTPTRPAGRAGPMNAPCPPTASIRRTGGQCLFAQPGGSGAV